jgi:hypothetical protein
VRPSAAKFLRFLGFPQKFKIESRTRGELVVAESTEAQPYHNDERSNIQKIPHFISSFYISVGAMSRKIFNPIYYMKNESFLQQSTSVSIIRKSGTHLHLNS